MINTDFTDEEWAQFQAIPEQGYSHRAWLDERTRRIAKRVAAEEWDEERPASR